MFIILCTLGEIPPSEVTSHCEVEMEYMLYMSLYVAMMVRL